MKTVRVEVTIDPKSLRESMLCIEKRGMDEDIKEFWEEIKEIIEQVVEQGWLQ